MPRATNMAPVLDVATITEWYDEIESIIDARNAAKQVDATTAAKVRSLRTTANIIGDLEDIDDTDSNRLQNELLAIADRLMPVASVSWDRDTINARFAIVDQLAKAGAVVNDDIIARHERLSQEWRGMRQGASGPRSTAPRVDGQVPAVVVLVDGERVSDRALRGDSPNSVQNIRQKVLDLLSEDVAQNLSKEEATVLREGVKSVVMGDVPEWSIGNITLQAVAS